MPSKQLVDAELVLFLEQAPHVPVTTMTLPQLRARELAHRAQQVADVPAFASLVVSEHHVPGLAGAPDVRVLAYQPRVAPRPVPVVLWIHGGGYVLGSADTDDLRVKTIIAPIGCAAVSVDYRRAPETPYPGPLEDCYAALQWLHTTARQLGLDPARIAVGGDSAGGGLAAALCLLARDRGQLPVAFQLLAEPMLDDRTATTVEPHPYAGEFVWTAADNRFGWSAYLDSEPGQADVAPYAAAARGENLAGLPPAFISVGALDLFVDEAMEYARRLLRAGVPTELHVYPGAYHACVQVPDARVSRQIERDLRSALQRAFDRAAGTTT